MKIERISWIVIVATLAILALNFKGKKNIVTKYLPGDTIYSYTEIQIPAPYDTTIYDTDTLWLAGGNDTVLIRDTVFIYNDYFKMYAYAIDTTIDEVEIKSDIKVTQNKLYEYNIYAKNNRSTKLIMTKDNSFGVGGIVGANLMAPTISYEFKNHQFGLGYDVVGDSEFLLMYQFKIKF